MKGDSVQDIAHGNLGLAVHFQHEMLLAMANGSGLYVEKCDSGSQWILGGDGFMTEVDANGLVVYF
ncbi:hypothetical protein D3C83_243530 [compost metagenome]